MAEVIGSAILTAVAVDAAVVGTAIGVSAATVSTLVGTAVILTGSLALSALTRPDARQKVAAQQFSVKQPLPSRRRAWGTVMLGGPFVAWDSAGGAQITAIYLCEGPIERFRIFYLDDKAAALPEGSLGGPAGVLPWVGHVVLDARLGGTGQAASGHLLRLPYWSAQHRLDGCAYVVMAAQAPAKQHFDKVFPGGSFPAVRALIDGARVRDVGDPSQTADPATWTWTDHAAPVIRDHITHGTWGMGVPDALMDDASFASFGALCGEAITDKAGTVYPRYYLSGTHDLTTDPADTLQGMLDACDGRLYLTPAGRIGITGGRYVAPEVTITQADVLSVASIEQGSGRRSTFNRLKTSFVSPLHDFQQVEGDPWDNPTSQAEAGEILEADFARPWVQNHNQLRRLAKIHDARSNPRWRIGGLVTNRGGVPALFEDGVILELPRYGISGPFEIVRAVASGDGTRCTFDLVSLDPAAWQFDAATEEGNAPPRPSVNVQAPPAAPVNPLALIERRAVNGEFSAVFLRLISAEPERVDLSLIGRYRRAGDTAWLTMAAEGDNRGSLISSVLADGERYEVEGAIATYGQGSQSDWIPAPGSPIAAVADPIPPAAPDGLTAAVSDGTVTLTVRTPASGNMAGLSFYRDGALFAAPAVAPSAVVTITDRPASGSRTYVARARNASGLASDPSNSATVTV